MAVKAEETLPERRRAFSPPMRKGPFPAAVAAAATTNRFLRQTGQGQGTIFFRFASKTRRGVEDVVFGVLSGGGRFFVRRVHPRSCVLHRGWTSVAGAVRMCPTTG